VKENVVKPKVVSATSRAVPLSIAAVTGNWVARHFFHLQLVYEPKADLPWEPNGNHNGKLNGNASSTSPSDVYANAITRVALASPAKPSFPSSPLIGFSSFRKRSKKLRSLSIPQNFNKPLNSRLFQTLFIIFPSLIDR
jgi:hypothetical protein